MKQRSEQGRLLFYTRDSGGRHEMTPGQYVEWAIGEARKHGLAFDGNAATIQSMIRDGGSHAGDVFLDYGVKGNQLSRDGLDALFQEISQDHAVSHVCIPRRDRLARPDQALDGVQLENTLRSAGVTLIYTGKILSPLKRGNRQELGDALMALVDFDNSGRFRRELANKIILAQIQLAQMGFSTGGRPSYGFRRWLVSVDGTPVRKLDDGERVRQAGHHTAWLPEEEEIEIIRRILKMLETMPASRVARTLTAEGIPSPNAGKYRTDNGVRHLVRGCWNATTITGIGRNRLLIAIASYGRRSMGDQLRHSAGAPRELTDADFRLDNKPKVTRNADAEVVTGTAKFDPVVDPDEFDRLQGILDRRAGTQRGKPRSRDPRNNPLGARIVDMNCTGPMYRVPRGESFRYVCALYQQSHGQRCDHNTVDGPTATRFTLGCLRQRLLLPHVLAKLEARLRALASDDQQDRSRQDRIQAKTKQLYGIEAELRTVKGNLARATSDAQFTVISNAFNELTAKREALMAEITSLEHETNTRTTQEEQLAKALETVRRLTDLATAAPKDLGVVREIFDLVNARMYLNFETIQPKKRKLRAAAGGVVTFGDATPPVELYSGPMDRQLVKDFSASGEGKSLGNANRGDWRLTFPNDMTGAPLFHRAIGISQFFVA